MSASRVGNATGRRPAGSGVAEARARWRSAPLAGYQVDEALRTLCATAVRAGPRSPDDDSVGLGGGDADEPSWSRVRALEAQARAVGLGLVVATKRRDAAACGRRAAVRCCVLGGDVTPAGAGPGALHAADAHRKRDVARPAAVTIVGGPDDGDHLSLLDRRTALFQQRDRRLSMRCACRRGRTCRSGRRRCDRRRGRRTRSGTGSQCAGRGRRRRLLTWDGGERGCRTRRVVRVANASRGPCR